MNTALAYRPCQCSKCAHRPVHGVCRCRICEGETPEQIRARMTEEVKTRCVVLLRKADGPGLSEQEDQELERLLAQLTRS